jgi:hypothetical protein
MSKVFNSTNQYAGFYQTFSGGDVAITIGRASGGSTRADSEAGEGFMVSQYAISFNRAVSTQRFLNMKEVVAILGAGQGTIQLSGLVGKLEAFQKLLMGSNNDKEDICNQLVVTITDASTMEKCSGGTPKAGTIRCSGGIVQGIQLGGTMDNQGVLMQTGSVVIQFTQLEINPSTK